MIELTFLKELMLIRQTNEKSKVMKRKKYVFVTIGIF